ncbi:CPBP family intramembrane metalloprotease [Amycolatopsis sp. OK19-0408]|uniref:CPBP family intramembrane metalloprotease n=1 Tax=Amycolatopsis iheyensis TaxID=2945988 RepID=A0A9X2NLC3_9PSEU|nr:CPBP family intramembrane glutamic endopeptidase [Amycolatopsis iheyensis]MCR6490844.1 CPBP family intramembrane metalloprotease [Amycolatopsis iheyensis]
MTTPIPGTSSGAPEGAPWHLWGFGAVIVVLVVQVASTVAVRLDATRTVELGGWGALLLAAVPSTAAALVTFIVTRARGNGLRMDLGLDWRVQDLRVGTACGLLALVVSVPWAALVGAPDGGSTVGTLVVKGHPSVPVAFAVCAYVALLGPIFEELVYRGLVWRAVERQQLRSARFRRFAAFILSTVLFAVSFVEPSRIPLLLVLGIPFGLARLATGRLLASVVAHQVSNFLPALSVLLAALGYRPDGSA